MIFAYIASIIAGIFLGITESINKNIAEERYSVFSYYFIQIAGNEILYLIPFFLFGKLSKEPVAYLFVILVSLLVILANSAIIKAYKTEDISNTNILSRSSLVIAFISGIVLLNEKTTIFNIVGILLIIFGILVIFYEGKIKKPSSGFLLALISGIFAGFVAYVDKKILGYLDLISLIFIYGIFTLLFLSFIPTTFRDIKPILSKYKKKIILSRIVSASAIYLFIFSISQGKISIANTNYETAFLLTGVLIGIFSLQEKTNLPKKLAGSFFCTLGIILLNFF